MQTFCYLQKTSFQALVQRCSVCHRRRSVMTWWRPQAVQRHRQAACAVAFTTRPPPPVASDKLYLLTCMTVRSVSTRCVRGGFPVRIRVSVSGEKSKRPPAPDGEVGQCYCRLPPCGDVCRAGRVEASPLPWCHTPVVPRRDRCMTVGIVKTDIARVVNYLRSIFSPRGHDIRMCLIYIGIVKAWKV